MKPFVFVYAAIISCGLMMLSSCSDSNNDDRQNPGPQPEPEEALPQPENEFWTKVPVATNYDQNVVNALMAIEGVSDVKPFVMVHDFDLFTETFTHKTAYFFHFAQLIDHDDPSKGSYYQQCVLTVAGQDRPTVLHTEGYAFREEDNRLDSISEPTLVDVLDANCLQVEHRYFGWSLPEGWTNQWDYLSVRQQCADLHDVVTAIKQSGIVGNGKWLSTGVSKNGMTTAFYAYYYPNDMDAYVPFCAPFMTMLDDPKVGDYQYSTAAMGDNLEKYKAAFRAYCSNKQLQAETVEMLKSIYDCSGKTDEQLRVELLRYLYNNMFQKMSYVRYDKWLPWVPNVGDDAGKYLRFIMADSKTQYPDETQLDWERRLESASDEERMKLLDDYLQSLLSVRAETTKQRMNPFDVQTKKELGSMQENISWVADLLTDAEKEHLQSPGYNVLPGIQYDGGRTVRDFLNGMKQSQCNIYFVYGSQDPWTGGRIPDEYLGVNSRVYIIQNGTHDDSIDKWNSSERSALFQWLNGIGFTMPAN